MKLASILPFIIAGVFAALFLAERFLPLRKRRTTLASRLVVNLAISGTAFLTALIAVRPSALKALDWTHPDSALPRSSAAAPEDGRAPFLARSRSELVASFRKPTKTRLANAKLQLAQATT